MRDRGDDLVQHDKPWPLEASTPALAFHRFKPPCARI
jgi:hypothetical protein